MSDIEELKFISSWELKRKIIVYSRKYAVKIKNTLNRNNKF